EPFRLRIATLPRLRDIVEGRSAADQVRGLAVEDLLSRAPIGLNLAPVRRLIEGRRVLVTGAGGSIGSELCRQIAIFEPASLVLFDRHENSLHAILVELRGKGLRNIRGIIGDITDQSR